MTLLCNRRLVLQALSLSSAWPLMAHSQDADFPSRPIKLIVPNAPGSSVDTIGRILGNQLTSTAGLKNFVENKAGAAGALGVDAGKKFGA